MDIVVFGQQNWDMTWTEKQQLGNRLARRGHRVLYVDPHSTPAQGAGARVRSLLARPTDAELVCREPGRLWVLSLRRAARGYDRLLRPRAVRHSVRRLGFERPAVLTFFPGSLPTIRALPRSAVVYFAVDEWTGFFDDAKAARGVRTQEEAMLREADLAIGISPRLQRRFAESQPNAYLLTNGVDPEQFGPERLAALRPHPALSALTRPRLGLIGQIDQRIDQALLLAMATQHPEWQIVLIGRVVPEVDVSALRAQPNVHFVAFQPHELLPQVLGSLDLCLIPYLLTPLTQSCNPAKAYEYLATGLPIVTTPLEGLGELRDVVAMAETPAHFVATVEAALADPGRGRAQRLALAAAQGWERRTDTVEAWLLQAAAQRAERQAGESEAGANAEKESVVRREPCSQRSGGA